MTKDELTSRLNDMEWDDFEVKEASGGIPKSMWDTICAFSNSNGGWIILGAKEIRHHGVSHYEITGVDKPEQMEQDIIGTLRSVSKFNVPILATAQRHDFNGKCVLTFHIPSSGIKPVFFNNSLHNTFIRIGSGDQRATDTEIDILMREKTFGVKSEMTIEGTGFHDLSLSSLHTYRSRIRNYNETFRYNDLDDEEFCAKVGITSHGRLTFGGLLMLGKGNIIKQYVPNFWIDYMEIPGITVADAECRYTYRMAEQENIWEYFQILLQRLRLFVDNPFLAGPDGYSPEDNTQLYCLREGLVNMLAHADYFSPMHSVIRVYQNRIEFQNPGRFAVRLDHNPGTLMSVPRNPNIISMFRYARQGENAGYGIDKIKRWKSLTGYDVEIKSDITASTLTYFLSARRHQGTLIQGTPDHQGAPNDNHHIHSDIPSLQDTADKNRDLNTKKTNAIVAQGIATRNKILEAMRHKPEITRLELCEITGITLTAIKKHIAFLKKSGAIVRLGSDRKGLWKVKL